MLLLLLLKLFLNMLLELLLLLLLLLYLPLNTAHHLNHRVVTSGPAFIAAIARFIRKRQEHELGVIGQRALHKHDALESGLDAGRLQPLHALAKEDAQLVERKQRREDGHDVAEYDKRQRDRIEALERGRVEDKRHAHLHFASRRIG